MTPEQKKNRTLKETRMIEVSCADFLIRHAHERIETLRYHINSQRVQLKYLRPDGRLAQVKRINIKKLEAEISRLTNP